MKRLLLALPLIPVALIATVAWLVFSPAPFTSVPWNPPLRPALDGPLLPNDRLQHAELLARGKVNGPEDTAVDAQGRVYAGTADGKVVRVLSDGTVEDFAVTGGRPLGLAFDAAGNLVVCDAWKGLLSIDPQGKISVLATEAAGVPFAFTDDLDIASDGTIYFSDASSKWHQPDYEMDLLESRPYGRLLAYDPKTKSTRVLLDGLYFANGVALSAHEDFVLVNETWRYRIQRYWLKGPKAGKHDIFIENLPGFPDNLSGNRQGLFWVALPSPRKADVDTIHEHPALKEIAAKLPKALRPKGARYGFVIALDEAGKIVTSLHDETGDHLREITSVKQAGDSLYFGSLTNDRIGKLKLSEALAR